MRIALLQPEVSSSAKNNMQQAADLLDAAALDHADLAVLPELWNTPFDPVSIAAHARDSAFLLPLLCRKAKEHHLWIVAGTIPYIEDIEEDEKEEDEKEEDEKEEADIEKIAFSQDSTELACKDSRPFNSCFVIDGQGQIVQRVDKMHLLEVHTHRSDFLESDSFQPGKAFQKIETPFGRIAVLICYDLRFPEAARLLCEDCFLLVVPAGFNAAVGEKHWLPLLCTRAMENQVFVCGVNPAACTYPSYRSYGHSLLVDPDGVPLLKMNEQPGIAAGDIDPDLCRRIRARQPFWALRRTDCYKIEEIRNEKN